VDSAINVARALFLALLLVWTSAAIAEVAVPPLSGRIVDLTGTLSSDFMGQQSARLKDLETQKGSQVAVLIVPTTLPETIEQYSIRAAEAWKIGRRKIDDGALLVIAKNDRKLRIEVGYGLEGGLTDVTARRIIDEVIVPRFKAGDFEGGVDAGLTRMIGVIDGESLPVPKPEAEHGLDFDWNTFWAFLGAAMIGGSFLRAMFGRLIGSALVGSIAGVIAWFFAGSLIPSLLIGAVAFLAALILGDGTFSFGPWRVHNGSLSWGGWSSGSSSSGGFSGGGGSFGGGGASGSW
jgi:uncharacterized protein